MSAIEWLNRNNVDLSKFHGNIGDCEGNICIETDKGWIFWSKDGVFEEIKQ